MKKSFLVRGLILISLIAIPSLLLAQGTQPTAASATTGILSLASLVRNITNNVLASLATLFMSLALLAFFYGIVEYIWGRRKGDATATKNGNQFMTWGLIALFVMFSVYGIIKFAQNTLAPGTDWSTITIPNIIFDSKAGSSNTNTNTNTASQCLNAANGTSCNGGAGSCSSGACVPNTSGSSCASAANGTSCNGGAGKCSGGVCVANSTSGGGGGMSVPLGGVCAFTGDCVGTGVCDSTKHCVSPSSTGTLKPNAYSCTTNSECQSGFCDPVDNTCSAVGSGGAGLGEGVACADTAQCASGLTCKGNGASNKICTAGSSACIVGNQCTTADGTMGVFDASCICQLVLD